MYRYGIENKKTTKIFSQGDAAVCPIMARANHSCKPNAEFVSRKDLGQISFHAHFTILFRRGKTSVFRTIIAAGD
jgi:hypothetical protein